MQKSNPLNIACKTAATRPWGPGVSCWCNGMKTPRFSPQQLILILLVALAVAALAGWRYFAVY